jgi:hypothetical protein
MDCRDYSPGDVMGKSGRMICIHWGGRGICTRNDGVHFMCTLWIEQTIKRIYHGKEEVREFKYWRNGAHKRG